MERGEWNRSAYVGTELFEKTLGIIGFGRVGRLVAERARAFDMTVVAYDPFVSEEVALEAGVTLLDLDDLLAAADIITLHTIISEETRNLINTETLAQMKDGVIIINVARGKLVDEAALKAALDNGKVRAAALDVFQKEPPSGNGLIGHPRVLHTPHLGASSKEAQRNVAVQIAEQVIDALHGTDFRNTVNLPFPPGVDFNVAPPLPDAGRETGCPAGGSGRQATDAVGATGAGRTRRAVYPAGGHRPAKRGPGPQPD